MTAEKQFTKAAIESAIANAMSRHSCVSTYSSALACKEVLEVALKDFE